MPLGLKNSILNQKGTPAFFSDTLANRPAFGFAGRVFISTDTGAIYEDTGTAWVLIADATGTPTVGTLQTVTTNGNTTNVGISITAGGLSANTVSVIGGTSSQFLKANGSLDSSAYITLTALSGTSPLSYNNTTGAFSITQSGAFANGYLTSTDWNTFNNKQSTITLTTTGTSGVATLIANTLNIPNYGSALSGYLPLTGGTLTGALSGTSATFSSSVAVGGAVTTSRGLSIKNSNDATSSGITFQNLSSPFNELGYINYNQNVDVFSIVNTSGYASGGIVLGTNNTERLRILTNGNVGIGTNNPTYKLEINGGSADYNAARIYSSGHAYLLIESTTSARQAIIDYKSPTKVYGSGLNTDGSWFIYDGTSNAERMRITSGGNLLVGTTTDNGQGKLQNTGQSFLSGLGIGGLTFTTNTTASVQYSFYFFNGGAGVTLTLPDTNGQSMMYFIKNNTANTLIVSRSGSNTIILAGTSTGVTAFNLLAGSQTLLLGNGTTNYIQIL